MSVVLARRRVVAAVDLRGGGLRSLTVGGSPVVESYPAGDPAPACSGAVLFPWPNRIRDGRWQQRGHGYQLPVNEPGLGNAAHGLVCAAPFTPVDETPAGVSLATRVLPQPGYPFALLLVSTYQVVERGIEVRHRIVNESDRPAPVCLGVHPYLRIGDTPTDRLTLSVQAASYLAIDDRLLPTGVRDVCGTGFDLRAGRALGGTVLNHCFADLEADGGLHRHRLEAPDGRAVELWTDPDFGFVQVYTCPDFPRRSEDDTRLGRAVAVEPMTAPPDAFNSGTGLRWLDPAQEWTLGWGITAIL